MHQHSIASVKHLFDYILLLSYDDGSVKVFDFTPELWGETMEPLKNTEEFRKVRIEQGALRWDEYDIDYCPDSIYEVATPIEQALKAWKGAA